MLKKKIIGGEDGTKPYHAVATHVHFDLVEDCISSKMLPYICRRLLLSLLEIALRLAAL